MSELPDLHIPLKGVYFDQIANGTKAFEYRLQTPYWHKRLVGRQYRNIVLTKGYPKRDDESRRLVIPWRGYEAQVIKHEHFGSEYVKVFAIHVQPSPHQRGTN